MSDEVIAPVVPQVPAAPATQPAAAPKEPQTPPVTPTDTGPTPHEYQDIPDDPGLSMALKFVGKLGFGPDHPSIQEAIKGNFAFLKADLASRGDQARGFEHYLALAEKSFEAHVNKQATTQAETREAVHAAVGGEEQWTEIQKWASANAEPEEKNQINSMLNAGGFQARAAAALLQQLYSTASGTVVEPRDAVRNVPANGASQASGAVSPAQYQAEMSRLVSKYGAQGVGRQPEYLALQQRRAAYRGQ